MSDFWTAVKGLLTASPAQPAQATTDDKSKATAAALKAAQARKLLGNGAVGNTADKLSGRGKQIDDAVDSQLR